MPLVVVKSLVAFLIMPQSAHARQPHDAIAHVFCEAAQEVGLRPQEEKGGMLQPRLESDGLPDRASHDRPADVWILFGKDMIPDAWDIAVTSCLRPATRNPGQRRLSKPCRIRYLKRDDPRHSQPTQVVFDGHAGCSGRLTNLVTWISHRLSTTSVRTPRPGSAHLFATPA